MPLAAFGAAPSEVVEREPAFSAKTFLDTLHYKRVDIYAGVMLSNVYGGLAFDHFKSQNIDPGAGIRVRF